MPLPYEARSVLASAMRPIHLVAGGRPRCRDGIVLCPASFPGAPHALATNGLIRINSVVYIESWAGRTDVPVEILARQPRWVTVRFLRQCPGYAEGSRMVKKRMRLRACSI